MRARMRASMSAARGSGPPPSVAPLAQAHMKAVRDKARTKALAQFQAGKTRAQKAADQAQQKQKEVCRVTWVPYDAPSGGPS